MIYTLKNIIQKYTWGSRTMLAELLQQPVPSSEPQAELWMGTHPKAPSQVDLSGNLIPLDRWIDSQAEEILGTATFEKFNGQLPFLFKILAVATPLSVQVHPNKEQAQRGFLRENQLGLDLQSPQRNYKDCQHKPEIICALSPFWMLNGFRPIAEIITFMGNIQHPIMQGLFDRLRHQPNTQGLRYIFEQLLTIPFWQQEQIIQNTLQYLKTLSLLDDKHNDLIYWIQHLYECYPTDIGVIFPGILNLVCLGVGEAAFINNGCPHSYLQGMGVELMANSDNVLRCCLTTKHKDIPELLQTLYFQESPIMKIIPKNLSACEKVYISPCEEFQLSEIRVSKNATYHSQGKQPICIMICTKGYAEIRASELPNIIPMFRGTSILIPAFASHYTISGNQATIYKATVPFYTTQKVYG